MDNQGRISLGDSLRREYFPDREVGIVGFYDCIRIYSLDKYRKYSEEAKIGKR